MTALSLVFTDAYVGSCQTSAIKPFVKIDREKLHHRCLTGCKVRFFSMISVAVSSAKKGALGTNGFIVTLHPESFILIR